MDRPARRRSFLILVLAGALLASERATAMKASIVSQNASVADPSVAAAHARGEVVAPPGQLDLSFGTGGYSVPVFAGNNQGHAVAIQPDGNIVVAGESNIQGNANFAVLRLGPNGAADAAFGNGGISIADFGGPEDSGWAVALEPDGQIVVAGGTNAEGGNYNFGVVRLQPNGSYDGSFGNNGYLLVDFGGLEDVGQAVALQPDGKILVAGSNERDFAVARLGSNGSLDSSFGAGGKSIVDSQRPEYGQAIGLQPDGKIIVAGYQYDNFAVARLESSGFLDTTFGTGGFSVTDFSGTDYGQAVAVQPDGKIVVAGYGGADDDFAVARLQPNGLLDTTFGTAGKSLVDFGGKDFGEAVALQAYGKILVAGENNGNFAVARLQPNGSLDTTFGAGGKAIVDLGGFDYGQAVAVQPDGKIVVAGFSGGNFAVARLQGDPAVGEGGGGPGGGGPGGGGAGAGTLLGPPTCAGKPATIVGTEAADMLTGTPQKDVIVGLGGRDRIRGKGASDIVCAGSGNDNVSGGGGKDRLRGERGNDRILGGPGADRLIGGLGRDRLIGGPGSDKLLGGPGKDSQQQ